MANGNSPVPSYFPHPARRIGNYCPDCGYQKGSLHDLTKLDPGAGLNSRGWSGKPALSPPFYSNLVH